MALFEEIEASIRKRARDMASRNLDKIESASVTGVDLNGFELFSVRAKFSEADRASYIDNQEKSAITTFKRAMIQLAFSDN